VAGQLALNKVTVNGSLATGDSAVQCLVSSIIASELAVSRTLGGRAIYSNACAMTIDESSFLDNVFSDAESSEVNGGNAAAGASHGGAILLETQSTLTLSSSELHDNAIGGDGGAIACIKCSKLHIRAGTAFRRNKAARGGAVCIKNTPDCKFDGIVVFDQNIARAGGGGGVYRTGEAYLPFGTCTKSASVAAGNYGFCPNTVVWSGNQALSGDNYATEAVQIQVVIGGRNATRNTEPIVPPPQVHLLDRIGQLVIDAVDLVQVTASSLNATAPLFGVQKQTISDTTGRTDFLGLTLAGSSGWHDLRFSAGAGNLTTVIAVSTLPCEPGSFLENLKIGFSCEPCDAGMYQSVSGQKSCHACAAGTFAANTGSLNCTLALPGQFTGANGSTAPSTCLAGFYQPLPGQSGCKSCVKGQYAAKGGAVNCSIAWPGHYTSVDQATELLVCEAGTYQDLPGQSECKSCSAGTYSSRDGAVKCLPTIDGEYTNTDESTTPSVCEPGERSTGDGLHGGSTGCEACPAATFSPLRSANCTACVTGQVQRPKDRSVSFIFPYSLVFFKINTLIFDCSVP
jgi:hypothetical protein